MGRFLSWFARISRLGREPIEPQTTRTTQNSRVPWIPWLRRRLRAPAAHLAPLDEAGLPHPRLRLAPLGVVLALGAQTRSVQSIQVRQDLADVVVVGPTFAAQEQ